MCLFTYDDDSYDNVDIKDEKWQIRSSEDLGGGNCWQSLQSNLLSAIFNDTNYHDQHDDDDDEFCFFILSFLFLESAG